MKCTPVKRIGEIIVSKCPGEQPGTEAFVASERGKPVAVLIVKPTRNELVVDTIAVRDRGQLRQRMGTRLYEVATEYACKTGRTLTSDNERSQYAEAFWRKQVAKGRATCVGSGRGHFFSQPTQNLPEAARARLPQPEGETWPCSRYGVTRPCEVPSLEGIRRRRRR